MFAALKAFGSSTGGNPLETDLKRVTESGVIDIPKELLSVIAEASHSEHDRRVIMHHLRECLAEPSGKRWRRVHAGLCLAEDLLKTGAPELLVETAEGRHFDLIQRLSLLEHFECTNDKRVQNMVRTKATALRSEAVPRLETASELQPCDQAKDMKDTSSTCSPGMASVSSCSTASSANAPSWNNEKEKGQMILNGIVAVGHRDDTTSESSGDEAPRPVAFRDAKRPAARRREAREAKEPKEASLGRSSPAHAPKAAQTVDLLEL